LKGREGGDWRRDKLRIREEDKGYSLNGGIRKVL
jgi:hypothetical protein